MNEEKNTSDLLNVEIVQPDYTVQVCIDSLGKHIVSFNNVVMVDVIVWGSKGTHNFQEDVNGKSVVFQVVVKMLGLTKCLCVVSEDGRTVHSAEYPFTIRKVQWIPASPPWAWVFVGLCVLIPFVSLGGAIPAIIGFAGAWICATIAAKDEWPLAVRVIACLVVTLLSWVVFGIVVLISGK